MDTLLDALTAARPAQACLTCGRPCAVQEAAPAQSGGLRAGGLPVGQPWPPGARWQRRRRVDDARAAPVPAGGRGGCGRAARAGELQRHGGRAAGAPPPLPETRTSEPPSQRRSRRKRSRASDFPIHLAIHLEPGTSNHHSESVCLQPVSAAGCQHAVSGLLRGARDFLSKRLTAPADRRRRRRFRKPYRRPAARRLGRASSMTSASKSGPPSTRPSRSPPAAASVQATTSAPRTAAARCARLARCSCSPPTRTCGPAAAPRLHGPARPGLSRPQGACIDVCRRPGVTGRVHRLHPGRLQWSWPTAARRWHHAVTPGARAALAAGPAHRAHKIKTG